MTAVQMDVVATIKRSAAIALGVAVLLLLLLLGWIGGEQHYRACLDRVALDYSAVAAAPVADVTARSEAADGCSRFPW